MKNEGTKEGEYGDDAEEEEDKHMIVEPSNSQFQ